MWQVRRVGTVYCRTTHFWKWLKLLPSHLSCHDSYPGRTDLSPDDILPQAGVLDIAQVGNATPNSLLVFAGNVFELSINL